MPQEKASGFTAHLVAIVSGNSFAAANMGLDLGRVVGGRATVRSFASLDEAWEELVYVGTGERVDVLVFHGRDPHPSSRHSEMDLMDGVVRLRNQRRPPLVLVGQCSDFTLSPTVFGWEEVVGGFLAIRERVLSHLAPARVLRHPFQPAG